jgi:flagellar biosynthesis/type III secretory pathway protein FliH
MSAPRARVVRGDAAERAAPLLAPGASVTQRKRMAREELEARLAADRIVQEAETKAEAVLARAREEATTAAEQAARAAKQEADAQLAGRWLALRHAEGARFPREADRVIAVAVVLAERLLGAALDLTPARIADLARAVLAEARGARRATVEAHPVDAEALRRHLSAAGLDVQSVDVRESEALARGELLLHTDLGTIDAKLAPRLDRLAEALRDALQ